MKDYLAHRLFYRQIRLLKLQVLLGQQSQDYSFMSVFPHMHLLGKDMECIAVTPTNDTINLI